MFLRLFKMRLKIIVRQKITLFWGIIFPCIVATFLYLAISGADAVGSELIELEQSPYILHTFMENQSERYDIGYYLAIIEMSCLLGGISSLLGIEDYMLRLSPRAIRMDIAPINKNKRFISFIMANWIMVIGYALATILYLKIVLGIALSGSLMGWSMLIILATLKGVLTGSIVGSLNTKRKSVKMGIQAVFTVGCGILTGLIDGNIKLYIAYYLPILAKFNPSALVVDGLFTLNVYGMTERFYVDILWLIVWNVIAVDILLIIIRRNKVK